MTNFTVQNYVSVRYKRKILQRLKMIFPDYQSAAALIGLTGSDLSNGMYPQAFNIDFDTNRVFVIFFASGSTGNVVAVYNYTNGVYISCFITGRGVAPEGLTLRKLNNTTVLGVHVSGGIKEYAVDTLPANLSIPSEISFIPALFSYQYSYSDDAGLLVEDSTRALGAYDRRYMFTLMDTAGNKTGRVKLPVVMSNGRDDGGGPAKEPLYSLLPKRQGTAISGNLIAAGYGGLWRTTSSSTEVIPLRYNGCAVMNTSGDVLVDALYKPDLALDIIKSITGLGNRMETEGVIFTPDGKIITLIVTVGHSSTANTLVLMEEFSSASDAIDFSSAAVMRPFIGTEEAYTGTWRRVGNTNATSYYPNPLTGTPVSSWADVVDIMKAFEISNISYNNAYTGAGAIAVPAGVTMSEASLVSFENRSNVNFIVTVQVEDTVPRKYIYNRTANTVQPLIKINMGGSLNVYGDGSYVGFSASSYLLRVASSGETTVFGNLISTGRLRGDGSYSMTTAEAANVVIGSNGYLSRSTSSLKYKKCVEDVDSTLMQHVINNARPIWYRSTCENDRPDYSWWGFAAEELAKVDPRLVNWQYPLTEVVEQEAIPEIRDEDGNIIQAEIKEIRAMHPDTSQPLQVEGVMYDRLTIPLLWHAQQQQARVETLEQQLEGVLRRLDALEQRLAALEKAS